MKKFLLFLSMFIVVTLACDLSVNVAPTADPTPLSANTAIPVIATTIPATAILNASPTALQTSFEGAKVFFGTISLVLPPGVASGISGNQVPRVDGCDVPAWGCMPDHTELKLDGYLLQGKSQQPQIYVYPSQAYAEMIPAAFESIHRLDNILYGPSAPISDGQLPTVPFFNAQQVFASNVQVISFQNGGGVRFVTEYAQYAASANNHDLFYHFQGVTRDGEYYIVAIFPITAPVLAETSDGGAVLPEGGIAYPYFADPDPDMQSYYAAVTALLNATSPETFSPTINQLDFLIQSMLVKP